MDASLPLWAFFAAAALPVSAAAVVFALQKAAGRENEPRTVPVDVEMLTEAVRRQGERLGELERRGSERDAELADALDRFARMTQRLAVRADRDRRNATEPDDSGDLKAILARRNGLR